jgi:ABC-type sugar transport system ATPase subunit
MGSVTVECVRKRFGQHQALDAVSLDVRPGEFLTILGPSGSGKTTLLRLIAGLEVPDEGRIVMDGRVVCGERWVSPQERGAGMVFQNYALWPHMTALENVAFPLAMRRLPRREIEKRAREAMALVELSALERKRPGEMSGGEQQRVALARALVARPAVLLLDESLSNLDARLREKMAAELRRVHETTGVTTLYVTHDQREAFLLSDRVAVLHDGKVQQVGAPGELYDRPRNLAAAVSMGDISLFTPEEASELGFALPTPGFRESHLLGARPESVRVACQAGRERAEAGAPGGRKWVQGCVTRTLQIGGDCDVAVQLGPRQIQARVRLDELPEGIPATGSPVWIAVDERDWIVLEDRGGRAGPAEPEGQALMAGSPGAEQPDKGQLRPSSEVHVCKLSARPPG